MPKYISLLRGINVSGQKKIIMADLRELYSKLGFLNITTYIQSGNVIFDSKSVNAVEIAKSISTAIKKKYQFDIPIIIITAQELAEIYANNPFVKSYDDRLLKFYSKYLKDIKTVISLASFKKEFKNSDFVKEYNSNIAKLYVTFLKDTAQNSNELDFSKWQTKNEELKIVNKHIYLYYPEGYGKSKLTNNILERKLGLSATTRNWKTITKLYNLALD